MSITATVASVPHEPAETRKLLLVIWAATAGAYLATGLGGALSTDDAMRLVQVRDFLGGQNWFDLTQQRLDPPRGVLMHWSRLVDAPLAGLLRAFEWALPTAQAERLTLAVWPAVLLLAFMAGVVRLTRELAGDAAARLALIFTATMAPVLQHFRPGAIDHHNVQLVLLIWTLALLVRARPGDAAIAGVLCGLSLAVGQELAPVAGACAAAVALRWMVVGATAAPAAASFGFMFAVSTIGAFAATVPPSRYGIANCDALSIAQVAVVAVGGIGLALLATRATLSTLSRRTGAALGLAAFVAAVGLGAGFGPCLNDPYAFLDPRLVALWLSNVTEARSVVSMARDLPQEVLPYYGLPALGLVFGLVYCLRDREHRWHWITATASLAAATLLALWQVRGCAAANAIALAMVPAALVRAFPAPGGRAIFFGLGRAALIAAALINPLTLIGIGNGIVWAAERSGELHRPMVITDGPGTCRKPADYAPLDQLPPGLVLAFIDAGPFVLMETSHLVLAAPYHRNVTGNRAMLDVLLGPPEAAGQRLAQLGVDYIALCPGAPERHNYVAAAPDGFAAVLTRGETIAGLERIKLRGTELVVYRRLR